LLNDHYDDVGQDTVFAGDGFNFVIGGALNDTVSTGAGNDVVCGDHCEIAFDLSNGQTWQLGTVVPLFPDVSGGMSR
jgi:Ca2+-binding RTX toxin-like protein